MSLSVSQINIINFLKLRGAEEIAHNNNKNFLQHLIGTAQILNEWEQHEDVINAGLLHSIYGTIVFSDNRNLNITKNDVLKLVSCNCEKLIFYFSILQRATFWDCISKKNKYFTHYKNLEKIKVSYEEWSMLLHLLLANFIEIDSSRISKYENIFISNFLNCKTQLNQRAWLDLKRSYHI